MNTIKINGKDFKVAVTWGAFQRAIKMQSEGKPNTDILLDSLWLYLCRRWHGFKPFIFKRRLKNKITLSEMKAADDKIASLIKLEDREGGN